MNVFMRIFRQFYPERQSRMSAERQWAQVSRQMQEDRDKNFARIQQMTEDFRYKRAAIAEAHRFLRDEKDPRTYIINGEPVVVPYLNFIWPSPAGTYYIYDQETAEYAGREWRDVVEQYIKELRP